MPVIADVVTFIPVGPNFKVSAIQLSAGGNMYVTEMH